MKKWLDTKSLKFKLWVYFGLFALAIMVILWLLQIIFLGTYYESMKRSEIEKLGRELTNAYGTVGFEESMYQTAFQTGVSIRLIGEDGKLLSGSDQFGGFLPGQFHPAQLRAHIDRVKQSKNGSVTYTIDDGPARNHTVVYGAVLTDVEGSHVYLYLTSPLAPVDATSQVLQNQLMIVTAISLLLGIVLAYFLARRISRPITKITASANILAAGDLDVRFDRGNYTEIIKLSDSLNHMAAELAKTDQLRRDLIANVSHDLKTPLTIIRSYAEMIRDISGVVPQKRTRHSQVIIEEADRLSLLVNDILDLSKLESGVIPFQNTIVCLSDVVRNIIGRFYILQEKNGYQFSVNCEPELYVEADEIRMEQVIYNLIGNAVNYTGDDKLIEISLDLKGNDVVFRVRDTGEGIDAKEQIQVFDRYYQASQQHRREICGSGIGLSIVKEILLAFHANFGVKSEPGAGSVFWFSLPVVKKG